MKILYESKIPYTFDCIATLSGGIDSTVVAHILVNEGKHPLFVYLDYETKSREGEIRAAIETCKKLDKKFILLPFYIYKEISESYIFGNTDKYDKGGQFWLEGRNGLIGFILAILASKYKVTDVYMGTNADDDDGYYLDTNKPFYDALNNLINHNFRFKVKVSAPLLDRNIIKSKAIQLGNKFGIDWVNETHSCSSSNVPCLDYEQCESCYWRRSDFNDAGMEDPFYTKK